MYRNASAVDETISRAKSAYGRLDSTADGEVFKSKFVREYYSNLLEDINRTLSVAQDPKSSFGMSPGLRPNMKDLSSLPSFGSNGVTLVIEENDNDRTEPLLSRSAAQLPQTSRSEM